MKIEKVILVALLGIVGSNQLFAQAYRKIFYQEQTIQNKNVTITIQDPVATPTGTKFKMVVTNLSNEYIVYKPAESTFKIQGKEYHPDEKPIIVRPNDKDYRVINLNGSNFMIAENYDFIADGFYSVSKESKSITVADFALPEKERELKAGDFVISLERAKKTAERTDVKFNVSYNGEKMAVYEPNRVKMKMPDGSEHSNYHGDRNPILYFKGDLVSFNTAWKEIPTASGNMMKDNLLIEWKDAFFVANTAKMATEKFTLLFDKDKTELKGK